MNRPPRPPPPEGPYAAALCLLPGMGTATLVQLLRRDGPRQVWEEVKAGVVVPPAAGRERRRSAGGQTLWPDRGSARGQRAWRDMAWQIDPGDWWAGRATAGIGVTWFGADTYPEALRRDPDPPAVLFWRGTLEWLARPCVALVGTRRATPDGRAVAFEMGRDLAAAGVCVVSGLALGIDGSAHAGAVAGAAGGGAGPVAVVASGVDVPYPRRHAPLWERVAAAGAVLSETLPGSAAEAWRFPVRNRIIAALSRMVVVVESHAAGGSLITAEAAMARGIDVRAVPGPVHSPASAGSNQLLYDGPGPVRCAQDVLDGLGIFRPAAPARAGPSEAHHSRRRPEVGLGPDGRAVLEAVGWRPVSFTRIVDRTGLPVGRVMGALEEAERAGAVQKEGAWWVRTPDA